MSEYTLSSGVLVCDHVVSQTRAIALIVHHSDGMWSFMCGEDDHDNDGENMHVVHVDHLTEQQADIERAMSDLRPGYLAERGDGGWIVAAHDD